MTAAPIAIPWTAAGAEANQASLIAEFCRLKRLLGSEADPCGEDPPVPQFDAAQPFAIDRVCELFGLSPFERHTLLLCAGVEMDSKLAALCSEARGYSQISPQHCHATFGLAMATYPDAHWSALAPDAPLRRFRLIEVEAVHGLTTAPLRIDERILHYLAGVNVLDPRLKSLLLPGAFPEWIAESHESIAAQAVRRLRR
jgi:hypothetical protein